jgi:hypothetical protein
MHNLTDYLNQSIEQKPKKGGLNKRVETPPLNASFLTLENINWWLYISTTFVPALEKRLFFLPCAGALKTRQKNKDRLINGHEVDASDTRKFISQSMSHQFMKSIREDSSNECVILSEPLVIIPYQFEADKHRPDYNLPVDFLSIQSEFIFIDRLSQYLLKLKWIQPQRRDIFYFGGAHHYFILHYANLLASNPLTGECPFNIIYYVPKEGIKGFARGSEEFMNNIHQWEKEQMPILPPLDIQKELKKRSGRYTHKPFLLALTHAERLGNSKTEIKQTQVPLADKLCFQKGFGQYFAQISEVNS